MPINLHKPLQWKSDIEQSVDMYNRWFLKFAPQAFRNTRSKVAEKVEKALVSTDYLRYVTPTLLKKHPNVIQMLRMCTCPPIAQDRLVGLAGISKNLVKNMEDDENPRVPPHMAARDASRISAIPGIGRSRRAASPRASRVASMAEAVGAM